MQAENRQRTFETDDLCMRRFLPHAAVAILALPTSYATHVPTVAVPTVAVSTFPALTQRASARFTFARILGALARRLPVAFDVFPLVSSLANSHPHREWAKLKYQSLPRTRHTHFLPPVSSHYQGPRAATTTSSPSGISSSHPARLPRTAAP